MVLLKISLSRYGKASSVAVGLSEEYSHPLAGENNVSYFFLAFFSKKKKENRPPSVLP